MRELAGKHFSDDLLKSLWLDLVASSEELSSLVIMVDKILELVPQPSVNYTAVSPDSSNNSTLEQKVAELTKQVSKLTNIVQNFGKYASPSLTHNRSSSCNGRYPSQNRHTNNTHKFCFYHTNFGASALKCKNPCNFHVAMPGQKDISEN
ncbi:hypothetical protein AVEN_84970-1 [Araneus ventricosus]|uniref:Uncharacterized protein n=1 Tax=Araneus ventricosus TaxID=182803 RepID=A0A4Y2BYN1_ARAVE|nr:hypothetical protein AVEN_84970-1 [Araneus ventricosus]